MFSCGCWGAHCLRVVGIVPEKPPWELAELAGSRQRLLNYL
jgi:hypothetical protein